MIENQDGPEFPDSRPASGGQVFKKLSDVSQRKGGTEDELTINTDNWERVVTLSAEDVDFESINSKLLPGESRTIKLQVTGNKA